MTAVDEQFELLDELIRKVHSLIGPYDIHDELKWLMQRDVRKKIFEKFPKCFLSLRSKGRFIPFFPICNMTGKEDPEMIAFSMKMADKMKDKPDIDQKELDIIVVKLQRLHNRFNKEIPKPPNVAAKKGVITKSLKTIGNYLKKIR